jgi:hypothetical protein
MYKKSDEHSESANQKCGPCGLVGLEVDEAEVEVLRQVRDQYHVACCHLVVLRD